ncbi:unnamed protein product [Allacma fusca]|uniref:Uncharacterized protein n=1 Tax=Allacma fusca TaxID=39272 RepID=A0A8J2LZ48_9HEXA|nr:unnamed protein product [Allacma fusca]
MYIKGKGELVEGCSIKCTYLAAVIITTSILSGCCVVPCEIHKNRPRSYMEVDDHQVETPCKISECGVHGNGVVTGMREPCILLTG